MPIHIAENGYPTGPGRSYEEQDRALREMVRAVHDFRGNYNVTDYRWFDLRDGDSGDPNFQQQFGLMRDDYTPKPAFETYRALIAELGCTDRTAPRTRIRSARVRRGRLTVTGTATDSGCAGIRDVDVAVARRYSPRRCRFLTSEGALAPQRPCRAPLTIRAEAASRWTLRVRLPRGRYRITVRGHDAAGNKERPVRGRVVRSPG